MGNESPDQHQIAQDLRRQAIERQNADFGHPAAQPAEDVSTPSVKEDGAAGGTELRDGSDSPPAFLTSFPDEIIYPSKNSQAGKARKWIWIGLAVGIVPVVAGSRGSMGTMGVTVFLTVLVGVLVDWFLRRQVAGNDPAVILTQEGIESRLFSGKTKKYPWRAIVGITFENTQNARALQLQLNPNQGFPDKRNFWTGTNESRPTIPLGCLEPVAQEKLYEAVSRRIQSYAGEPLTAPQGQSNPLTEEREFQERLKSLAPIPWVTYGLIALNVVIWAMTVTMGATIAKAPAEMLLLWGGNATSEVQRGDWWRLLSATFLHSGLMHIAMNMIGLASAGITVERIYGHRQFILLYLGSGLIGSALSLHFSAQQAVSVGASGAVFGITGALLVGLFQHRKQLPKSFGRQTLGSIGFFIVYSLMQGFAKQGIDNAAHVGGLLGGCLLAYVLPERFDMEHFVRTLKTRMAAGMAIAALGTVALAATAPPASVDQKRLFEGQAAFMRALTGFDTAMRALQEERRNVESKKISERETDERSRTVFAPMLRQVTKDFSLAYLAPSDPRIPLLKETRRMSELLLETLEMESVYPEGKDKPEPADPARMAAIEAETKEVGQRLEKILKEAQAKKSSR